MTWIGDVEAIRMFYSLRFEISEWESVKAARKMEDLGLRPAVLSRDDIYIARVGSQALVEVV